MRGLLQNSPALISCGAVSSLPDTANFSAVRLKYASRMCTKTDGLPFYHLVREHDINQVKIVCVT